MKSHALISDGNGNTELKDIEVRKPKDDEVLVEIKAAGICTTDLSKMNGLGKSFIPGHEGAGIVLEIGSQVSKTKVGDRVILNWAMPCQYCFQCNLGNENLCETNSPIVSGTKYFDHNLKTAEVNGTFLPRLFNLGTFSKHTIVSESAVTTMGEDVPFTAASIISCSVLTGYSSVAMLPKFIRIVLLL